MHFTITTLLVAFFLFAGSIKLTGWQKTIFAKQLEFFLSYGLNRSVMALVGLVECVSALALVSGYIQAAALGAVSLCLTSLGAIAFHLRFDTWTNAIPALVTAGLSAILCIDAWPTLAAML
ncbi:DoxX family protein [Ferrimonas balearica]|uniref:DoxX family protein n=1 Tax=Ferrimonas balearica TaxID=44012 RepID=UPI001C58732F|nr:DoxX family protein [Ferrimonas balearica]MBW3141524.1 DoxX family protein [Ferrimonas balearica]